MHIIVVAIGTAGDVNPLLGLSRTFAKHGHRVSFCTHTPFADAVERCGLRFLPLGTDKEYRAVVDDPELWNPRTTLKGLWTRLVPSIRLVFETLQSEVEDDTVIASHTIAFGARLFQEKYGVPLLTLQVTPSTFPSAKEPPIDKHLTIPRSLPYPLRVAWLWALERGLVDRIMGSDINRFRAELGLSPVKRIMSHWVYSPDGVLGLYPAWFAPIQTDWPARFTLTGFPLFDQSGLWEIDDELKKFLADGPAPIVFTPGSTLVDGLSYYTAASNALDTLGQRGIFLASQRKALPTLPSNVLVRPYVPLSKLLPRVKALVHHGGIGTVSQAFAAGIPQLVTPFAFDQFDNAARVERLGCGLQINSETISSKMLPSLRSLLEDEDIHKNCATVQSWTNPGEIASLLALSAIEALSPGRSQRKSEPLRRQAQWLG